MPDTQSGQTMQDRRNIATRRGLDGRHRARLQQSGYGYLLVLAMIAVLGWQAARTTDLWRIDFMREREAEMVFAGGQIKRAIAAYFENGPQPGCFPTSIDVLFETRNSYGVRLLRKRFHDPLASDGQWGRIEDADGRLHGVYSLATGRPIVISLGRRDSTTPAGAVGYDGWRFVYRSGAQQELPAQMCPN